MTSSKPPALRSPHDRLFKATFSQPEEAARLVKTALPPELAETINWNSLALEPGSFVDETLKWRHTDLLFSARQQDQSLLIYLLIEHQSQNDNLMAFRMSTYVHRILEQHVAGHPNTRDLPPVVPLVISHAAQSWTAPLELIDLFDIDDSARTVAAPYLPNLRYFLDDLSAQTEEALQQRQLSEEGKLTVLALRQARVKFFAEALKRWAALLRNLQQRPGGHDNTARFLSYMLDVGDDPPEELRDVLQTHIGPEASEVVMSTAERLREEGRLQGQARTLLRLLELKFGRVPEGTADRLAHATAEQLDQWTERVLTANALNDVLDS